MDWTQAFTVILTIVSSMVAVWYAFYLIIKEDIKVIREDIKENRAASFRFQEKVQEEASKRDVLWADLLRQIYDIKLDQSRKNA